MRITLLSLCLFLALTLLLTSCGGGGGGGGGGGVTPPSPTDAARYFPLAQGTQWVYSRSQDESKNLKVNDQVLSNTHYTTTGIDTCKIAGTYTGDPFPADVTTTIRETDFQGTTTDVNTGQQWNRSFSHRSFFTNENGVVKFWGEQEKEDSTWGKIHPSPKPLVVFQPGVISWTAGPMQGDIVVLTSWGQTAELNLSGSFEAVLSQETITVPAGTYPCYKVTITLKNVHITPPTGWQVISGSWNETLTIWLALDKGIVQSTDSITYNATLKDPSGATINFTFLAQSTTKLTSFTPGD